jgi:hypothetical protein
MRTPALAGFGNFRRSPLAVVGFLVFFVVAAYKVAGYVIVLVILNDWRNGLYFFLTWLLFEDFARKYLEAVA